MGLAQALLSFALLCSACIACLHDLLDSACFRAVSALLALNLSLLALNLQMVIHPAMGMEGGGGLMSLRGHPRRATWEVVDSALTLALTLDSTHEFHETCHSVHEKGLQTMV